MKTTMIARCVFAGAAIFAAAGLIGCGAESGQGETGAIGSTSEALTATGTLYAASCVVHDSLTYDSIAHNRDLELRAGGYTAAAGTTPSRTWELVDSTGTVVKSGTFGAASTDEIAHAQMLTLPSDNTKCLLVGGETGSGVSAKSWLFTMSASAGTFTGGFAQDATLNSARERFVIKKCAANKIIAFGGVDGSGAYPKNIEVWNTSLGSGGTWVNYNSASAPQTRLGTGRMDIAVQGDPTVSGSAPNLVTTISDQNFAVFGGNDGAGAKKQIDLVQTDNTCAVTGVVSLTGQGPTTPLRELSVARDRIVAIPEGKTSHHVLIVGAAAAGTTTTLEEVTLDFATPNNTDAVTATPTNFVNTRGPALVTDGSFFYVIGGEIGTGTADLAGLTTANVKKYNPNATTSWSSLTSLGDSRVGHVAEYLPSAAKIVGIGGDKITAGPTRSLLSTVEVF